MYDPYYETKVMTSWSRFPIGIFLGICLIFLGVCMIVFSIADITAGESFFLNSAFQENSIWPTIGKGIWVGLIVRIQIYTKILFLIII
jgi:hypothetical protein